MKYNNKDMKEKLFSQVMNKFEKAKSKKDMFLDKADIYFKYYYSKLPLSIHQSQGEARNKFIEPIARTHVDALIPPMLYVFTDNRKSAVSFQTDDASLAPIMKALNKEMGNIILRDSDGAEVIQRCALDAAVTGVGVANYGITDDVTSFDIDLSGMTALELINVLEGIQSQCTEEEYNEALASVPQFELEKYGEEEIVPEGISITYRVNKRKPYLTHVPVTNWFADPTATNQEKMNYFCHVYTETVGTLMTQGYKKKDLEDASFVDELSDPIKLGTDEFEMVIGNKSEYSSEDELVRDVTIYNHFIKSSIPLKGKREGLFQVITTDSKVLLVKEVDFIPYLVGNLFVDSNSLFGDSYVRQVMGLQDRASLANEARSNKAMFNTFGRYTAVKGAYDKRALLDNRPGGVVEVEAQGAIQPFPESQLDPGIDGEYMAAKSTSEELLFSASGAKGDALTQSNISSFTAAISQHDNNIRSKMPMRSWSRTFMEPLMQGMYNLLKSEGYALKVPTPEGEEVSILFAQLPPSRVMVDNINTLFDDLQRKDKLNGLLTVAVQGQAFPTLQQVFSPEKIYHILEEFLEDTDIPVEAVVQDVTKLPQPSEEEVKEAMEQKAMATAAAKLQLEKAHLDNEVLAAKVAQDNELFTERVKKEITERVKLEFDMKMKEREVTVNEKKVQLSEEKLDAEKVIFEETGEQKQLRSLGVNFN